VDQAGPERQPISSQPQHLLLTLLGDYWFGRKEHLPSAALVHLLTEFGVSTTGARAALSRLSRRGLLESSKLGRRTYYGLTPRAIEVLNEGRRHILTFGLHEEPWDGSWVVTTFSVPEDQRHTRHALRTRLRWLGFAPLYDAVWVSPHASVEATMALLSELGVEAATVFTGEVAGTTPKLGNPISAWKLDELRALYQQFIEVFTPVVVRMKAGRISAAEGLVTRTEVMDAWRNFPGLDPELPSEITPTDWPRAVARRVFVDLYDGLGPLGEMRIRQIVHQFSPVLAPLVSHHTTAIV
jgi:phenylacetic acid degradation operon negative regulatory protein